MRRHFVWDIQAGIIVVIVQSKIVQAVNLVQVAPRIMATACVTMVIVVDDVIFY